MKSQWAPREAGPLNQEQTGLFEDHGAPWSETDGALGQEPIVLYSKHGLYGPLKQAVAPKSRAK